MTGAQDGLRFVDEQEGQRAVVGAFPALDEQVPHLAFRFAHPHVQNLRPLDVQEEFRPVHTALGLDLLAQIVSGRLAQQSLATARRAVKEEALGHRVLEAFEQVAMQERKLDRVADSLHRLLLAADGGPGQFAHRLERTFDALSYPDHFQGHALVDVQADVHAGLESFFAQQRGPLQNERHKARFLADAQPAVGKQLIDPHDRPVAVETKSLDHRKGFVQQNALTDLKAGQRNLGINAADIIGAADTHMGLVRLDGHQQRADPEGRGAQFLYDRIHLFDGLAGFVVHFLDRSDALAQVHHVKNGGMTSRQFADDQVDQLQRGKPVQLLASKQTTKCWGNIRAISRGFAGWRWRHRLLLWLSHAMTLTCFVRFANPEMHFLRKKRAVPQSDKAMQNGARLSFCRCARGLPARLL